MERSRDGMRKAVQNWHYSGGIIPYGYQLNQDTKRLEINTEEAEIIRRIFYWLNEEKATCYSIAKRLNALGIPTRYAKDKRGVRGKATANLWRAGRVYNMVRNTAYKGEWVYGKRAATKQNTLINGSIPHIVDPSTFDKAQIRLRENSLWADRNCKRFYLLRGLVRCEICGHSYSGYAAHSTRHGEIRYYRCNVNGSRGNLPFKSCDSPSVRADLLEGLVWQQVSEFVRNPETVKRAITDRLQSRNKNGYMVEINESEHRLEELLEAEKRLLRLYADPHNRFSKEALDTEINEIAHSKELIQKHLQELIEAQENEKEQIRRLENIDFILGRLNQSVKHASPEVKRQVIESLLQEVRVGKDNEGNATLRIIYAFEGENVSGLCYDDSDVQDKSVQLGSARMSLWLLR